MLVVIEFSPFSTLQVTTISTYEDLKKLQSRISIKPHPSIVFKSLNFPGVDCGDTELQFFKLIVAERPELADTKGYGKAAVRTLFLF
jgi:hypothetical protein